ncbi:MAG TPA: acyclic terpene utilization AtuA family protein [Paracoccaceae bacterium]|nr:acyclic terpene utilization AtuA family protein [Paracoccaceae bacterium]
MTRILIPSGALGLGYDAEALARGIAAKPDLIAIDGGSTDSGPSYLGRGVSKYSRAGTKAEWKGLVAARAEAGCPLVIGTAGTCGTDSTVDWLYGITVEILSELGLSAKIAVLRSEQPKERVASALAAGRVAPLPHAPEISADLVHSTTHIVALAGAEQIAAALETGADIVIAGRTTDTAIIAALPLMRGDHAGAAWHAAKIGECGALCATNPQSGVIQIDIDSEGFTVTPLADGAHCTPHTVSAHMLYENSDPFILYEPGGYLDVTAAKYIALDDTRVRVIGSKWVPSDRYTVKLEGARVAGYQTLLLATIRDRRYVENIRAWVDDIAVRHAQRVANRMGLGPEDYSCELRIIGVDATLGALEIRSEAPAEAGVMGIITAPSQETANEIGKLLNPFLLHHPLTREEEQPTFAFPFSPAEIDRGAIYEFCLNHVMELDNPMDAFMLEVRDA